ncbi:Xaa-Pro dipeptidase [Candidatus Desantisbacteria bacterium CG_4_10_14_0_8_um_filter_48_22]|uniref:Xaa-Pro dipeptidase n=1 Tax=Candidatus Desantisbacteria bacterium CG_4_10_14_0_8_um_filter_48_22 TaxID=1974543 RepID=A0A2M7SAW9_9BACT|nr:MAG: hypothetical protein AUJ67_05455 [Candidatus Desantisbacteria bacterium CG1_02_49_89]PIZ16672.1 MAG: Xaa-Pro dipeptidase [Candidatus Desantisbacteria bacterium CG_4_10_14_0_8_um_filter_48_22]
MSLQRIKKLREKMKEHGIDALLVSHKVNRDYLLNINFFIGGVCLVTSRNAYFLADFCNYGEVKSRTCGDINMVLLKKSFIEHLRDIVNADKVKKLGIEHQYMSVAKYDEIKALKKAKAVYAGWLVEELRMKKEKAEIDSIRKASELSDLVLNQIPGFLKPGITEKDAARRIDRIIRDNRGDIAFDTIVASGVRSGYPHGTASDKVIKPGDAVVVDLGAQLNGYSSDCTRTFFAGKPDSKQKKVYGIVRQAQEKALKQVKEGAICSKLDSSARALISKKGFGKYFGHSLGHGVGREVHELPHVSMNNLTALESGMVITIEPGIYLPDGFGVRIEDLVVVTKSGFENLSKTTKDMISV